jgi:dTDP-glucose 4,6-dehydratase
VLVTGAAGFIGSALCRRLAEADDVEVLGLDKLAPYAAGLSALPEASARWRFVKGDILDEALLARLFAEFRPDAIMHLAGETHVDVSIETPRAFVDTNVVGAYTMLQAALSYWSGAPADLRARFRYLHMSTDEVFGVAEGDAHFSTESPFAPRSPYAASKAAGDHLAMAWRHTYGLPVIVANSCNAYGPFQHLEKLIPLMIVRALRREPLPLYGDGLQERDWIHVDDLADGLIAAVARGEAGGRYLFSARDTRCNRDVVTLVCDAVEAAAADGHGRRALIELVADRPGHDRRYAVDPSSAEALSWSAGTRFEDGVRATVDWYLQRREWWLPRLDATRRRGLRLIAG